MGTPSVIGLALAVAVFGVIANHARDMYRDRKYREMFGTLFWATFPIAVFGLFWAVNEDPSVMARNITLGIIGAAMGAFGLIWIGYFSQNMAVKAQTPSTAPPATNPGGVSSTGQQGGITAGSVTINNPGDTPPKTATPPESPAPEPTPNKPTGVFIGKGAKDIKFTDPIISGFEVGTEIHGEGVDFENPLITKDNIRQIREWPALRKWSNAKLRSEIESMIADLRIFETKYDEQERKILIPDMRNKTREEMKQAFDARVAASEAINNARKQEFEKDINPRVQPLFEETVRRLGIKQIPREAGTILLFGRIAGAHAASTTANYLDTLVKQLN